MLAGPLFAGGQEITVQRVNELRLETSRGEGRPFLLADRTGTYLYGFTGDEWDSGWMGLWVRRNRVLDRLTFVDADGKALLLNDATCDVYPSNVVWTWPGKKDHYVNVFFQDTLLVYSGNHVRVEGGSWIQEDPMKDVAYIQWPKPLIYSQIEMSSIQCDDSEIERMTLWAHAQLLGLLAENDSLLYAGIPWFNEGWGRDTFISLPGLLVTGHYDAARKLLMRFAGWIDRDPNSPTYGRIPNRVRPGEEIVYNTADGTPWWMREVYEYGIYSGDYAVWDTLLSDSGAMRFALDAAVQKSDSFGFLMHGDADTWMDAVGPDGPHTPRGNRAIEIQALHFACLDNAQRMTHKPNPKWKETAEKIRKNFLAEFIAPSRDHFYDRLMADGTPDTTMRPNQMFAFTAPYTPLVPPQLAAPVTKKVASELFYEHGVLSLSPEDTCFHPFHQDWHYPKDDAYHQGIVWVWNSGPAKSLLIREGRGDLALKMMDYEAWHMRERGMVGSLPELFDAVKRSENEYIQWSGTTSQAWSLAEYLRATYQDFLGIRPVVYQRDDPFWLFAPRIPIEWGLVRTSVNCSGTPLLVAMQQFADSTVIELQAQATPTRSVPVKFFDVMRGITGEINTTEPLRIVYRAKDGYMLADGKPTAQFKLAGWPYDQGPKDLAFAPPIKTLDFAALKDPEWEVLTGRDTQCDVTFSLLMKRVEDPAGDDKGDGAYEYPTDEHFEAGILDLRRFEVRDVKDSYSFEIQTEKLAQPGWHPEYGFQLTYAAICLHTSDATRTDVGANSNLSLDAPFSRVIYVGGGVRVEDGLGETLGEFIPRTNRDAFGDVTSSMISFCLPKSLFPERDGSWEWTVLCGAQDDHGGAGIGEFRAVNAQAERWSGGGNLGGGSNVYDRLSTLGQ
ncbi:MAG: hypothetical protein H6506_04040 [Calditrichaeota bacterium]|nr:hypothetical protein [Calditrichota bacterium]MCB9391805.1 hypothetical protein [Calditrichota bacterium]